MAPLRGERGAVLMTVLFMVMLLGLTAGMAGQALKDYVQREREAELLWRGEQYRRAIASYAAAKGGNALPNRLDDLVRDPRSPAVVRHLRRLYNDPVTGGDWELIMGPGNRIMGVRSTSELPPFRQEGFPAELTELAGKTSYREWQFVFVPKSAKGKGTEGQKPPGHPSTGSKPATSPHK